MGVLATWLQKAPGQFTLLPELSRNGGWSGRSPILTGDLDGDGKDDFVAGGATGRLVSDTWHYSATSTGSERLGLFDWDGDGILEYTSADTQSRLARERAALSDLELTFDSSQSPLGVSGALSAQLAVTNHGPTATEGFAFTTTLRAPRTEHGRAVAPRRALRDVAKAAAQATITAALSAGITPRVGLAAGSFVHAAGAALRSQKPIPMLNVSSVG